MDQRTQGPQYEQQLCEQCACGRQNPVTTMIERAGNQSELQADNQSDILSDDAKATLLADNKSNSHADGKSDLQLDSKPVLQANRTSDILADSKSKRARDPGQVEFIKHQDFPANQTIVLPLVDKDTQIEDQILPKRNLRNASAQTEEPDVCLSFNSSLHGASKIQYCDMCYKQCAMCSLQAAQKAMDKALTEMSRSDGPSEFCICSSHQHFNQSRYHHISDKS